MKNLLKKRLSNEKGLTLVELLAVIVILGIIAAIAIPSIGGIIQNTREKAFVADTQNALAAANLYFVDKNPENGEKVTEDQLVAEGYFKDLGSITTATTTFVTDGENTITSEGKAGSKPVKIEEKTNKQLSTLGRKAITTTP